MDQLDIEEYEPLKGQIDSRDLFILGFLKGFNRSNMQAWARRDLAIFDARYN